MCVCVRARSYIHTVARTNSYKNVVLRGCGMLRRLISYFLATRSSQMNVEVAKDVDPIYLLNPCSIVGLQVHVGRRRVGVYSNICVVAG